MAQQQQQQGGGGNGKDNSLDFLWMIVMIVIGVAAAWYFGKEYITAAVFQIRLFEITAIEFVIDGWNYLAGILHLPLAESSGLTAVANFIQSSNNHVSFDQLAKVSAEVGRYTRYPVAVILVAMGVLVYLKHVTSKYRTKFDMAKLQKFELQNWPQIAPVVGLDLVDTPLDEGPWAMSQTPMQFAKTNDLLNKTIKDKEPVVSVKKSEAHQLFALQLGRIWTGKLDKLPIHIQALFAIFAARGERDREGSDKLLSQISRSADKDGQLNFTGTQDLLKKHINSKLVSRAVSRHAYVYTVMASMLGLARTDGVLASSEFLWLKPVDRKLWYILNGVGRQTPVSEVSGPFAHWKAELKVGRALRVPMVDQAVIALESAIADILYEPEED